MFRQTDLGAPPVGDEVEVLLFRPDSGELSHAVKVIHKPTGTEVVANDFDSQIKNKSIALIGLLSELRFR